MSAVQHRVEPPTFPYLSARAPLWRKLYANSKNPIAMYTEEFFHEGIVRQRVGKHLYAQVMLPEYAQLALQGEGTTVGRSPFSDKFLRPALREGLLTAEYPVWRPQRRASAPAFRARELASLMPVFSSTGDRTAERFLAHAGTVHDVGPDMTRSTLEIITETLLHNPENHYPTMNVARDVDIFLTSVAKFSLLDFLPGVGDRIPRRWYVKGYREGEQAVQRLRAMAIDLISVRMKLDDPGDDLTGLLIKSRDPETGEGLTAEQLVDNVLTFIGAGHETTAAAMTWALYILAQAHDVQDAMAEEAFSVLGDRPVTPDDLPNLPLHDRVLKEVMRLYPPVPVLGRSILSELKIADHTFVPGDHIMVGVYPMQRHFALWDDPMAFNPDRFLPEAEKAMHKYQWIPFGGGPRVCIGLRFAMMEMVAVMAALVRKVRFTAPEGLYAEPFLAITIHPKDGLPLRIDRR